VIAPFGAHRKSQKSRPHAEKLRDAVEAMGRATTPVPWVYSAGTIAGPERKSSSQHEDLSGVPGEGLKQLVIHFGQN
jgi:hypothetical protein